MSNNAKMNSPICLQLGENGNFIVTAGGKFRLRRTTPTMGTHYGFVVTTRGGKVEYPTESKICAVGCDQQMVQVYEEDKEYPWQVDVSGTIIEAAYNEKAKQKVKRY